jgi:hypothetical protein
MFVTVISITSFTKIEPVRYEHLLMNTLVQQNHTLVQQNHTLQATNYSNYETIEIPLILKLKHSRNRPGVAQRVPGGLGSQIFMTFGT